MPHTVREWMSTPVVVVDSDTAVSYAMTLMRRRHIHSVVVDVSQQSAEYAIVTTPAEILQTRECRRSCPARSLRDGRTGR
jgi:signal-transduction protein with cAMP-binding, CBS, and nucleotidyltransferase domain